MSGIIKSAEARYIVVPHLAVELTQASPETPPPESVAEITDDSPDPVEAFEERLAELRKQIAQFPTQLDEAREQGVAEGVEQGLHDAEKRENEKMELLAAGIVEAQEKLDGWLSNLDQQSVSIAHYCIERLFGPGADRSAIVRDLIANQISKLQSELVISIIVSKSDFADDAALDVLAQKLEYPVGKIEALESIKSGGCEMKLSLGSVDIGLDTQWSRLNSALDELAQHKHDRNV